MLLSSLTTFLAAWCVTALSRLPPGPLTLAAVRTADRRGVRAAAVFLAGAWLAELAVTAVVVGGFAYLPLGLLQDDLARRAAMSLALAAAGAVLLWPSSRTREGAREWRQGSMAVAGFGVTLSTPGLWTWWATVGVVVVATLGRSTAPLPLFMAMAAGLATSHVMLLLGLRTMIVKMPRLGASVRQYLGAALLVAGLLVAILG